MRSPFCSSSTAIVQLMTPFRPVQHLPDIQRLAVLIYDDHLVLSFTTRHLASSDVVIYDDHLVLPFTTRHLVSSTRDASSFTTRHPVSSTRDASSFTTRHLASSDVVIYDSPSCVVARRHSRRPSCVVGRRHLRLADLHQQTSLFITTILHHRTSSFTTTIVRRRASLFTTTCAISRRQPQQYDLMTTPADGSAPTRLGYGRTISC